MAAESMIEQRRDVKAARVNVKLVLAFTEGLFRHRKTLTDGAWEKALDSGKKILRKSQREPETRCVALGLLHCFTTRLTPFADSS